MVIVMDSSTGKRIDEFAAYEDEVLLANWMPQAALGLTLRPVTAERPRAPEPSDIDGFMRRIYLSQE